MTYTVISLKRTSKFKELNFFHICGFICFLGKPQVIALNKINRTFIGELVCFL